MIITGVNGFIGKSAREYFETQYDIAGIDLAAGYQGEIPAYYQCNMSRNPAELASILTDIQPDVILHCAGSANVGASVVNPLADLDGNLHSLYQLLLALKSFEKRPQIIFLSSAAVYGNPKQLPIRESDAPAPISPYGTHKLMCEQLCDYYNRVHGYKIRMLRIFSVYGNGIRKQLMWDTYQKYHSTGKINLFGTGNETRDFIHITDLVQAMEKILAYKGEETIFNVANGEEVSIREVADIYIEKLNESQDIVTFNGVTKEGDPQNWRADISLLKKTGYRKNMDFKTGLGSYVEWVQTQDTCL